ncbi:hypothetical protein, variant 2 [Phytophthora nicotianae CJ01A1]|uniref:Uncharacterized protein n=5 Tax=Phytophthora nicotianae TaxID=4792 RepID=V9G0K0_PHYNI|nr:hypothetical protein PPTG_20831 [Phytophthora nicotianae INRA-310]ETI56172.1 hypothetical protein F443_01236 [Phytophthora nicotianae P1569]ETK95969.1 hypothetical protein L915_01168 [Phytophthora nicotianae]ETO59178.1 hypothetical protein F444_22446 [Phytophthora nicotianae P1976]ETP00166.1 hypothetical protein F441_22413 [Phytophthora nicotianae CJ01A1]ETI56173.1 hypothetical protein, variant 1 [Phytophthora nicotianae P1569]
MVENNLHAVSGPDTVDVSKRAAEVARAAHARAANVLKTQHRRAVRALRVSQAAHVRVSKAA